MHNTKYDHGWQFANYKILLKPIQQKFSNYGQIFPYLQQTAMGPNKHGSASAPNSKMSSKKLCFHPSKTKGPFDFMSGNLTRNAITAFDNDDGIQFGTRYVELYLYNESTRTIGLKTCLTLPSHIVCETLKLLDERWKNMKGNLAKHLEEEIDHYKQEQLNLK